MKDDQIIDLFFRRDEEAITITDRCYGAFVRNISMQILQSREDAEECVEDAYLSLWNNIPPEKPRNLKAYLTGIVRNISVSKLRKKCADKRGGDKDLLLSELEDCIPSGNNIDSALDHILTVEVLNRWLEKQKPGNRSLFLCRYWYGFEYRELTERFHATEKQLILRLHRMRKDLKKRLEKEGISV